MVGLFAVLILGAWGIIILATKLPSFFENAGVSFVALFSDDEEATTTLTAPLAGAEEETLSAPQTGTDTDTTYVPASAPAQNLYGSADLRATILSAIPARGRMNVQFAVENIGTNIARAGWAFAANIPWYPQHYTYSSPAQRALYPGDKIVYFLGFDLARGGLFILNVDAYGAVAEQNELNNTAHVSI